MQGRASIHAPVKARRCRDQRVTGINGISFRAPNMAGKKIQINAEYINDNLGELAEDEDLSRYIL